MKRICGMMALVLAAAVCMSAAAPAEIKKGAVTIKDENGMVRVMVDGKEFTTYRYTAQKDDPKWLRPYFWPVTAADGVEVTSDQIRLGEKEKTDHPHHRSIWVGWGDVNGTDNWTNKTWQQRHVKFSKMEADGFVEELTWDGKDGPSAPVLTEMRTVKFTAYADGSRGIEITTAVTAASEDAVFKCKPLNVTGVEAGWAAVRVAKDMWTDPKKVIVSGAGEGEKIARGEASGWCDFSAHVAGKMYGVSMVNGPKNPGGEFPWHVRETGWLAHIGQHNWTLPKGQTATIKHLIIVHEGDAQAAHVLEKAKAWRGE